MGKQRTYNELPRQHKEIVDLLRKGEVWSFGIGRKIALQLPRVMNDLKKWDWQWTTRQGPNLSVYYILLGEPRQPIAEKSQEKFKPIYSTEGKVISYRFL